MDPPHNTPFSLSLTAEFWRKRFEREKRTRRALEDSLQAMAIEHSQLETQGTVNAELCAVSSCVH